MTTDQFGKSGDPAQSEDNEGNNFGNQSQSDQTEPTETRGQITSEELAALQKRDVNAQQHIPQLESENESYKAKIAELEADLSKATTMQDVLDRMSNPAAGEGESLNADAITLLVDNALNQKEVKSVMEANWASVETKLTETYGDWKTAVTKVDAKAAELGMTGGEATTLAEKNPKAFLQLFDVQDGSNTDNSTGVRTGGDGVKSTVADRISNDGVQDAAFYRNLLKTNPREYWKEATQIAYRRDVHGL